MRKFDWLVFCRPVQNALWPGSFQQLNLFWMRVTCFAFDINEIAQSYVWTHYPKQLDQGSKNLWCRSLCSNLVVIIAQKMKMLLVYFSFLLISITAGKILNVERDFFLKQPFKHWREWVFIISLRNDSYLTFVIKVSCPYCISLTLGRGCMTTIFFLAFLMVSGTMMYCPHTCN